MTHPFGDLVHHHLSRKPKLTKAALSLGTNIPENVLSEMCAGKRLQSEEARERVIKMAHWFFEKDVLFLRQEIDDLLAAAGKNGITSTQPDEQQLLEALATREQLPRLIGLSLEVTPNRLILDGSRITIGRGIGNVIEVAVAYVSQSHADVIRQKDRYTIRDLKSTHGTFINGTRIEEHILFHNDLISFGSPNPGFLRFIDPGAKTADPPMTQES